MQEEPWFPPKEGYTFMQSVGEESLVHGTRGPATKKECEVSFGSRNRCEALYCVGVSCITVNTGITTNIGH